MKYKFILLMFLLTMSFAYAGEEIVFYEGFDDGDISDDPSWTLSRGKVIVSDNKIINLGLHNDNSGRYWSSLYAKENFTIDSKITFSFDGKLNSQGTPQEGRGIVFGLYDLENGNRYSLNLLNGFVGRPIDTRFISFGAGLMDHYIKTSFVPERDRSYHVMGIIENNKISLFVDGVLIGETEDPLNYGKINLIKFILFGTVEVDNLKVVKETQIDSRLQKYAPVFYLHDEEYYSPKEIECIMPTSDLYYNEKLNKTYPLQVSDITDLEKSKKYYLDNSLVDIDDEYALLNPESTVAYNNKIYARLTEDQNGYTHIQYYQFYPFQNHYASRHEGDWQMVQVTLNPAESVESVTYHFNIFSAAYYEKEHINWYDNTHPVVYVGKGSHNNYASPSSISLSTDYLFFMKLFGKFKEFDDLGEGKKILPASIADIDDEKYLLEEIDYDTDWISFAGHWGQKSSALKTGPKGPRYNPWLRKAWEEPERLTYAPNIPFASFFVYSPMDIFVYDKDGNEIENISFYSGPESENESIIVYGEEEYHLKLVATGEGKFDLCMFYYINESGIMTCYYNQTTYNETLGHMDVNIDSYFGLEMDYDGDDEIDDIIYPDEFVTYNDFPHKFPMEYKKEALELLKQTEPINQTEEERINIAINSLEKSLHEEIWNNIVEPNTKKVFVLENVAELHSINPDVSRLLALADRLIYEKAAESGTTKNSQKHYTKAKKAEEAGNYHLAIVHYMNAWWEIQKA